MSQLRFGLGLSLCIIRSVTNIAMSFFFRFLVANVERGVFFVDYYELYEPCFVSSTIPQQPTMTVPTNQRDMPTFYI